MAALENRRHERFAQLLAATKPSHEAYLEVGFPKGSSYRDNARKLANKASVKARVAELQERIAEYAAIDAAWIKTRVARIADSDLEAADIRPSDVIAAAALLAKMTPGALVAQTLGIAGPDGVGPAKIEFVTTIVDPANRDTDRESVRAAD